MFLGCYHGVLKTTEMVNRGGHSKHGAKTAGVTIKKIVDVATKIWEISLDPIRWSKAERPV